MWPSTKDIKLYLNKCGVLIEIFTIKHIVAGCHSFVTYSSPEVLYIAFKTRMQPMPKGDTYWKYSGTNVSNTKDAIEYIHKYMQHHINVNPSLDITKSLQIYNNAVHIEIDMTITMNILMYGIYLWVTFFICSSNKYSSITFSSKPFSFNLILC